MLAIAWETVRREPGRMAALAAAVALPTLLVVVVTAVYVGLLRALVAFPATLGGDLVVLAAGGSPMFLRGSTPLPPDALATVATVPGVARVDPLHGRLVWVESGGEAVPVFVVGLLPHDGFAAPLAVVEGPARPPFEGILVDRVLAHDLGLARGASLRVGPARFRVRGITAGGNAVLGSFAFVHRDALVLAGMDTPSHLFVTLDAGADTTTVAEAIARGGALRVWTREAFLAANQALARRFYRPLLAIIAGIAAGVGGLLLALTLRASVLERREDWALLRALGAGRGRVVATALWEAGLAATAGVVLGLGAGLGLASLVEILEPRFVTEVPWWLALSVAAGGLAAALLGAVGPARAAARTDPALVLRV